MDFLEHEVLEIPFFRMETFRVDAFDRTVYEHSFPLDGITAALYMHHVAIVQEYDILRVRSKCVGVGRKEKTIFLALGKHERAPVSHSDHFSRIGFGDYEERISTFESRKRVFHLFKEICSRRTFNTFGYDFTIGLAVKRITLVLKFIFQILVILDDAVVCQENLTIAIVVRVGIFERNSSVGSPTRMPDS